MSRPRTRGLVAATLFLLTTASAWAQVSVPNTFSAGTAAKASEVNANFQALVDAINSTNTVANTPLTADGSLDPLRYSTASTLAGRNVVVMKGTDTVNGPNDVRYSIRAAYRNGTVNVGGAPTVFAYVRLLAFIRADAADSAVVSGVSVLQGTNDLASDLWNTEINTYGADLTVPTLVTDTRTDDYLCFTGAISGHVRQCRLRIRDTGKPTKLLDDSRIFSEFTAAFTVGSFTFLDGGVQGAYLSDGNDREWFLLARHYGIVAETRRYGIDPSDGNTNLVSHFVIYLRRDGAAAGSVTGTIWATGANQVFFTP